MVESDKKLQDKTILISAKTLAKMLSTSVRTVWRYRSAGKLPKPVTIGCSVRWLLSDIEKWIEWGCCGQAEFRARKEANHNE